MNGKIMEADNKYIRFDWAIKHILRDKANFGILEGFISVLLNEEVRILEILESEANQENSSDKFNRVDIKAKNSKGHLIIVKIQLIRQLYYLQRILRGTCKVITGHTELRDKCDRIKKVYSISILYCNFGRGNDYVYHGETCFKGLHTDDELLVNIKEEGVIVPHLPREMSPEYYLLRVNKYTKVPETPLDEWMEYLKTGIIKENTSAPGLLQVKEKLCVLDMSLREYRAYLEHLETIMVQNDVLDAAREEGFEEIRAKRRAEAREQGKWEMVVNMVKWGVDLHTVCRISGFPIDELKKAMK